MSGIPHDHSEFFDWCYRCQLHKDEIADIQAEVEADAKKAADLAYESARAEYERGERSWAYARKTFTDGFIAGYLAAEFRT